MGSIAYNTPTSPDVVEGWGRTTTSVLHDCTIWLANGHVFLYLATNPNIVDVNLSDVLYKR